VKNGGLILDQPERGYRYSVDPFLLAGWCTPRRGERILDLGAGVGVIGLLLARRCPTVRVIGIELNGALARHAEANARANALDTRFLMVRGDLREAPRFLPPEHFHRVVANPPFRRPGSGAAPPDPGRAGARLESTFSLSDLARTASALLRSSGVLDVVHLPERLPELWLALAASGLEPKLLRLVAPFDNAAPRLCLVSATKGARPGLRVLPQLVLHRPGGGLSDQTLELLGSRMADGIEEGKKRQQGQ
jgi:tRNA1Val (adenine37-N6)-methyltransferase